MSGPVNALPPTGDGNFGTDIPETHQNPDDITIERHMARFSQTQEFAKLKSVILSRIDFYKQYAPGSSAAPVAYRDLTNDERGWRTLVADVLIEEFNGIINAYELAGQVVDEATTKPKK